MLPLKTLLYISLFIPTAIGSFVYHPVLGILAYFATYNINPIGQWWGSYLPPLLSRYSYILAIATALGIIVHSSKLRFRTFLDGQEILLLLFLVTIWGSVFLNDTVTIDYNVFKMSKVIFILLLSSHVITKFRHYESFIWILILCGLWLGLEVYSGSGSFLGGRFNYGVGGSDFSEGNFLAAHYAIILPFISIILLKSPWKWKIVSLLSAFVIINSIVITRSRGTFIALVIGALCAFIFSLRLQNYRNKIIFLLFLGSVCSFFLFDISFLNRIGSLRVTESITFQSILNSSETILDSSAGNRLIAWRGAWSIAKDNPLGIGVGQFFNFIGFYEPSIPGKDTHNTYLRCLSELGFQGLFILCMMIFNAFRTLVNIDIQIRDDSSKIANQFRLHIFALKISLVVYLIAGMFISSTYIEEFYWLLMMPVFLKRSYENELEFLSSDDPTGTVQYA